MVFNHNYNNTLWNSIGYQQALFGSIVGHLMRHACVIGHCSRFMRARAYWTVRVIYARKLLDSST